MPTQEEILKMIKESGKKNEAMLAQAAKEDGMEIRSYILHASLHIEANVRHLLTQLLDYQDEQDDDGFNFAKRIWFLKALGTMSQEDASLLDAFREIRNKFIHEKAINSYEACFRALPERKELVIDLIKKDIATYPFKVNPGTEAEYLELGTRLLTDRAVEICQAVEKEVLARRKKRVHGELFERWWLRVHPAIYTPFGEVAERVAKSGGDNYSRAEVTGILKEVLLGVKKIVNEAIDEETKKFGQEQKEKREAKEKEKELRERKKKGGQNKKKGDPKRKWEGPKK